MTQILAIIFLTFHGMPSFALGRPTCSATSEGEACDATETNVLPNVEMIDMNFTEELPVHLLQKRSYQKALEREASNLSSTVFDHQATPTCGSEKIGSGQCYFKEVPNGIKDGAPWRGGYDHYANTGHYRILADNAEACAAKLAPTAGTDVCPNPNMFVYNHKYKICLCLRRPSRTDCDTYKHPDQWNTYSFAGCTVPAPKPQPAAPPGKKCGDVVADGQCRHHPENLFAHEAKLCGPSGDHDKLDGPCTLKECTARVAAHAGTDLCPNKNIFIYNSNLGICRCQWRTQNTYKMGFCDDFFVHDSWKTYSLSGSGSPCNDEAPTPAPTQAAPFCVKTGSPGKDLKNKDSTIACGPGANKNWATPYCPDIQGCTPYCPAGCNGFANWEHSYSNPKIGLKTALLAEDNRAHFVSCLPKWTPGRCVCGKNPCGTVCVLDCRSGANSTKPPVNPNAGQYKHPQHAHITTDMANVGYIQCPPQCGECAYYKFGNFHSCGSGSGSGIPSWCKSRKDKIVYTGPQDQATLMCEKQPIPAPTPEVPAKPIAPTYTKVGNSFCKTHEFGKGGHQHRTPYCQKKGMSKDNCEKLCTKIPDCIGYVMYKDYCMPNINYKLKPQGFQSCHGQPHILEIVGVESPGANAQCFKKVLPCTTNTECGNRLVPEFICSGGECKHCDTVTPTTESDCQSCPGKAWTGSACVPCKGATPSKSVCSQCGYGWSGAACASPAATYDDVGRGVCKNGGEEPKERTPYCQNYGWGSGHAKPPVGKAACEKKCSGIPDCIGYTTGNNGYCFLHLYARSAPDDFPYCFNQGNAPLKIVSAGGAAHIYSCYRKKAALTPQPTPQAACGGTELLHSWKNNGDYSPVLGRVSFSYAPGAGQVEGNFRGVGPGKAASQKALVFPNMDHTLTLSWERKVCRLILPYSDADFNEEITFSTNGPNTKITVPKKGPGDSWDPKTNTLSSPGKDDNQNKHNYADVLFEDPAGFNSVTMQHAPDKPHGINAVLDLKGAAIGPAAPARPTAPPGTPKIDCFADSKNLIYGKGKPTELIITCKPMDDSCLGASPWGTGIYTWDSKVCLACVHMGVISRYGGVAKIVRKPGQNKYKGTIRNGYKTKDYGAYPKSFSCEAPTPEAPTPAPTPVDPIPVPLKSCTASTEYNEKYACENTYDGEFGKPRQDVEVSWATKKEGAGSWIKLDIDEPRKIDTLLYTNRRSFGQEENKDVQLKFSAGKPAAITLKKTALNDHTLYSYCFPEVTTGFVKLIVKSHYTKGDNGAEEIAFVYTQGECPNMLKENAEPMDNKDPTGAGPQGGGYYKPEPTGGNLPDGEIVPTTKTKCVAKCAANPACKAWNFRLKDSRCTLKGSTDPGFQPDPKWVSGEKAPEEAPTSAPTSPPTEVATTCSVCFTLTDGTKVCPKESTYHLNDVLTGLSKKYMGLFDVKTMKVTGGCTVILYPELSFEGAAQSYTAGSYTKGQKRWFSLKIK